MVDQGKILTIRTASGDPSDVSGLEVTVGKERLGYIGAIKFAGEDGELKENDFVEVWIRCLVKFG